MKSALVTGSAGFVGSHFARRLASLGYEVMRSDPASRDPESRNDCRDLFAVLDRVDLLVHAAAVIGSREDRDRNPMAVYENLALDQSAFAWCARTKTPLLYFSSSAAYPIDLDGPFVEDDIDLDHIANPDAAYGFIKLVGERQCRDLRRCGVFVSVVRPFSGYANDQSLDYPFPTILSRVRRREDPLVVWSDTERDFVHIDDVVSAALAVVDKGIEVPINIGTGVPTRMTELARTAAEAAGYAPEIRVLDKSAGPDHRYADTHRLFRIHQPLVTIEEGIRRALGGDA